MPSHVTSGAITPDGPCSHQSVETGIAAHGLTGPSPDSPMFFPSNGPVLRPDARHHTEPGIGCTEAFFRHALSRIGHVLGRHGWVGSGPKRTAQTACGRLPGMQFAVNIPNFGELADAAAVAELAQDAEAAGWDGFFVWDHIAIAEGLAVADPFVVLAAVALRTERMTIGTLVTPLPRRRPWVVARQCTTLDHMSGGRFVLGVGIGYPPEAEFGIFGEPTDARTRAAMLDEGLDVLQLMWSGHNDGFHGEHYTIDAWSFAPSPLQRPRIPIWVAGTWPNRAPFRRAARYDGVYPLGADNGAPRLITDEALRRSLEFVAAERGGLEGYEVAALLVRSGNAAADADRAHNLAELGVTWAQIGPDPNGESLDSLRRWVAAGPPL